MLQKKKLSTPTTRFASVIEIFDFSKMSILPTLKRKKSLKKSKKFFSKYSSHLVSYNFFTNFSAVTHNYLFNKKPYQLFLTAKSIYNNMVILPGIEFLNPGKKIFNCLKSLYFKKISYLGSQIYLVDLPYGLHASYISNNYNNKWTFARSSGTFITKLKAKKTVKLVYVELPSSETYLFFKNTKCFIGKNNNFFNNKFVEGKWGYSIHRHKTIAVRGVAMNPVDHPNGGRTKAKQPEKSPWGWIAKNKK